MDISLSKWQTQVWDDTHRFRVVCAGRRSGKSVLSQLQVITWANTEVGRYWIVAPTYKQAKTIHWEGIQHYVPQKLIAKKNEVELSLTLTNGSVIELKGAENPDALRGVKIRGLVIDEIASIRNWNWLWSEVLRPTLTDYEAPVLFISTPKGYNHFFDLYEMGQGDRNLSYKSWKFTSYNNPYIPKGEIDNAKKELTEDTFAQEYLADFRKHTGMVYKDFERETHVIEPFDIGDNWRVYRGIDFGSTNPTACLWIAVDGDDNWFIIDEHYETGETIDYHAGIINAKTKRSIVSTYGDPSGAQWIKEFAQRGIYITPANKEVGTNYNSWVRFGIEKVSERLKQTPGHIVAHVDSQKPEGMPKLFIFSGCIQTIREFETYRWKEKSVTQAQDLNEPDVPEKANDHCFTGETMILTKTGWRRIDKIKKGEYVWSPFGWNEVYRAGSTGIKKVKDYGAFRCTPDHKILTTRGLVEVDKLRYYDKMYVWKKSRAWSLMEFLIGVTQIPKRDQINFIFGTLLTKSLMARQDFYTETYGNTITAKFLMAIWFIILVGTLSITTLLTLSLSILVNMPRDIIGVFGRGVGSIWKRLDRLLLSGTDQKKEENYTFSWVTKPGKTKQGFLENAINAGVNIPLIFRLGANGVINPVKPQILGVAEVFNLATKFGCYFANGILVSNSMDALRYFAVSYKKHQPIPFDLPVYVPSDKHIGI